MIILLDLLPNKLGSLYITKVYKYNVSLTNKSFWMHLVRLEPLYSEHPVVKLGVTSFSVGLGVVKQFTELEKSKKRLKIKRIIDFFILIEEVIIVLIK